MKVEYKAVTTVSVVSNNFIKGDYILIMGIKYEITEVAGPCITFRPYRWYYRILAKLKGVFRVR